MLRKTIARFVIALAVAQLPGCVVYEPYPGYYYPGGNNFDRAWNAALGAVQDAGMQVQSSDPSTGVIRSASNAGDAVVTVARQADGTVRVQFNSKGPAQQELAGRFSQAYERRMGR